MESSILIVIALVLGYGQGIKSSRNKQGKEGGVLRHFKEKVSHKWQLIREQDEQIWMLKEKIQELEKKNEKKQDVFYTKGKIDDFQKELFSFVFHQPLHLEKTICFCLYISTLLKQNYNLKEEKYTQYVYSSSSDMVNKVIKGRLGADGKLSDFMIFETINKNELAYDFETVETKAQEFVKEFNDFNYDITFGEVELALKYILELFL